MISISIVSHGQFQLVENLLADLEKYCKDNIEVLLTINIPEKLPQDFSKYHFPVKLMLNSTPKGFGANHNSAFRQAMHPFFCVLNPDIRLYKDSIEKNIFLSLINKLNKNNNIGVIAPMIVDEKNILQDSARKFLTMAELLKRIFCKTTSASTLNYPDWVAGMFMLFRNEVYEEIKGFDEAYYLYCEDMDICARLRKKNYEVYYDNTVKIIHSAQRQSHRNMRYLIWHIESLLRFFYLQRKR